MIAIHNNKAGFSEKIIDYCSSNNIEYKIVDCYKSDIVEVLEGCDALFWHHTHADYRDVLFAKQLLQSLIYKRIRVFPDYNSGWHFDDKVAQKYLLESIGAPLVQSYVFYDKKSALNWARLESYPKVFKLRGGAGATNVKLVKSYKEAKSLISRSFGQGFSSYNFSSFLKDGYSAFLKTKNFRLLAKPIYRYIFGSPFIKLSNKQKGYAYFQEFIPNNDSDTRVIVIGKRAFGIKRLTRENDFRASGSGKIIFDKDQIDIRCVQIAFEICNRINASCLAFDFVFKEDQPLVVEISYGFSIDAYNNCEGYWDETLTFYNDKLCMEKWIIETIIP